MPTILRSVVFLFGVLSLALLGGCAKEVRPDLTRLYQSNQEVTDQPPVILVHGLLGGKLKDRQTGEELWLGSLGKLLFSSYQNLALDIDPIDLKPLPSNSYAYSITDKAAGQDFYLNIIQTLETAGGYIEGEPGSPVDPKQKRYYVFVYDWRQDNVVTAARLADYIEQIRRDYADPDLKVDIVAHSMGGLVTRYYMRYGRTDVLNDNEFPVNLNGAKTIRRVVLLGTPSLGSVDAVGAFIEGYKVGFGTIPTEVLATMPSLYQLFPHNIVDWIAATSGKNLRRDIFQLRLWRRFKWSIFDPKVRDRIMERFDEPRQARAYLRLLESYFEVQLNRARRFQWSLTVPLPPDHPKLVIFGGDCVLTPSRVVVEEIDGETFIRRDPSEIKNPVAGVDYDRLMLQPGDGTVTKASLLARDVLDPSVPRHKWSFFPIDYALFLCEEHRSLTGNVNFQDNLLHVLLSQDYDTQ